MTTCIYGLFCPVARAIRYIGKADNPQDRYRNHIRPARNAKLNHHCARWIRQLLAQGLLPELRILAEVSIDERWQDVERRFIAEAIACGADLTNTTEGGQGLHFVSVEHKRQHYARTAASQRAVRYGSGRR